MLDRYCEGDVERISPEAPIPILSNYNLNEMPGGAANVAVNLSKLGCKVNLISLIGKDQNSKLLKQLLKKYKINFFTYSDNTKSKKLRNKFIFNFKVV